MTGICQWDALSYCSTASSTRLKHTNHKPECTKMLPRYAMGNGWASRQTPDLSPDHTILLLGTTGVLPHTFEAWRILAQNINIDIPVPPNSLCLAHTCQHLSANDVWQFQHDRHGPTSSVFFPQEPASALVVYLHSRHLNSHYLSHAALHPALLLCISRTAS